MHVVDLYERIWMWMSAGLIALFVGAIVLGATAQAIHPPSHVETIDPARLAQDPEFGKPGVRTRPDGSVVVTMTSEMFSFAPDTVEVPAGRPVTFRITSSDVVHGLEIAGTNVNTMAIPGYVSEVTVTFPRPGEYFMVCHEYCGELHGTMTGKLVVRGERP